jgi:acyl carrier protein
MANDESMKERVQRLVHEYAQNLPAGRSLGPELSLRKDLAVESLSLVSLTIRLGDELGVDVVELDVNIGPIETIGDLIALGQRLSGLKQANTSAGVIRS